VHSFVAVVVMQEVSRFERPGTAAGYVDQAFSRISPELCEVDCECRWETEDTSPDPECPDCHGEGEYKEYFNHGGYDCWEVGGRFDGLAGAPSSPSNWVSISEAVRLLRSEKDYWFAAILTPDGILHRDGSVLWSLARTARERRAVKSDQIQLLQSYEGGTAIGVDCHD
jgi:hypothetical protein